MSRLHPFSARRAFAAGIGALLAAIGTLAIPGPAEAAQTALSGSCAWEPEASEWVVTWTLTPEGAGSFRLAGFETTPADSQFDGFSAEGESLLPADEPLVGAQRVPQDATTASLNVSLQWDLGQEDLAAEVAIPADCEVPEPPDLIRGASLSCTGLTITIENPSDAPMTLRFEPSRGDPLNVEVAAKESAIVEFPASPGLSVDVLLDGRSIVDASDPIEILPAEWEQQSCDEDDDDGEGGGLPATGLSITLAVAGALVLVAVGTGLYLTARRRRITFTA